MTIRLSTLSNGFRVITETMPGLRSASLGVWIGSGSRDERAEENGVAHFLEHMAFKGMTRRSALDIAEEIYNFARFYSLGFARSVDEYARPQVNTSALVFSAEPKKGVTNE